MLRADRGLRVRGVRVRWARAPRGPWVLVVVAVVVLLGGGAGWWCSGAGAGAVVAGAPKVPVASASASVSVSVGSVLGGGSWQGFLDDVPEGQGPVVLPRGGLEVGSWRLGYPRSASGALGAAVEYVSHSGCLDEGCVAEFVEHAASPAWSGALSHLRAGVRVNRARVGLEGVVGVPEGATVAVTAMAFQFDRSAGPVQGAATALQPQVRVVLLCYQHLAGPGVGPSNRVLVVPVPLRWDQDRWVVVPGDRSYTDLGAVPGTGAARALGWRDFVA